MTHECIMRAALSLARRNLGQTWPNPSVGAIVAKDGRILAQGYTARGGRPHAETEALNDAAGDAKGATLYVTLEPCSHQGKTPPCTDAIIKSGIKTVVFACRDPNPQVNGQGIAQLKNAGIEVIEGICAKEAAELNRGFFSVIEKKRPYVAVKIATSLDGKIAHPDNQPRWITSEPARNYGHLLRSRYDAIATGIGTVLADDPLFTCRLPGMEYKSPVRIVFDRQGRLPPGSQMARTAARFPLWPMNQTLPDALQQLAEKGITRLLVEAGQSLTGAFLDAGLVDKLYWFKAPVTIGRSGLAAPTALSTLAFTQSGHIALAPDHLDIYECLPASSAT